MKQRHIWQEVKVGGSGMRAAGLARRNRLWIDVEGRAVRICWQTTRGVREKGKSQARGDLKK